MQLELQTETNYTSPSLFDITFEAMNSYGLMKAAIMPISQSVAWYTIVQPGFPFYNSVCGISAFLKVGKIQPDYSKFQIPIVQFGHITCSA
jgi:hypothetical protein